jgi:chorismate dehydratase
MGEFRYERLRLGKIGFLNVLPIYYPLETGIISHSFDIVSGTPACLNGLMSEGNLDLSVVSSIEYARHPERYFILPDLSISCNGAVKSVLLLSQVPISQLRERTILASTQSHTSVALLKVLFSIRWGMDVTLQPGNCTEALDGGNEPAAFLAIGDEALRYREHERYPYRYDLGEEWLAWTGLPFVFALWVIQRKAVERWNGHLTAAIDTLTCAKEWGQSHLAQVCAEAMTRELLNYQELLDYYRCLGFNLRREEQRGLELFYGYLVQMGEVKEFPRLEIFSPLAFVA